jgi:hypothetical protein
MLVCDQVIREQGTNKVSLIGVFDRITAPTLPAMHWSLAVYVTVLDAEGDYDLRLELVRVRDDMAVGRGEARVAVPDRFQPSEWIFNLQHLVFQEAGRYEFRLWANGRHVASKTFSVIA